MTTTDQSRPVRPASPARRYFIPQTSFAVCSETMPFIAARVYKLMSWGRRYTVMRRYLDREDAELRIHTGLKVAREPHVQMRGGFCGITVVSRRSLSGDFSISAVAPTPREADLWKQWHSHRGGIRNEEFVDLNGGLPDSGPGMEDMIRVVSYGPYGVPTETTVVFDTDLLWQQDDPRQDQLPLLATDETWCSEQINVSDYRVRCFHPRPRVGGVCPNEREHDPYMERCWPESGL